MKQLIFAMSLASVLMAQESVDEAASARMRSEELEHSKIMHTLHMLTDRYGPRVTGTPNHEAAAKWAIAEMTSWGMKNGHLEPWDFGRAGWLNESATGMIVAPVKENLKFEVLAWTPSTKGTVNASAMEIVLPQGPLAPVAEDAAAGSGRPRWTRRRPGAPGSDERRDGAVAGGDQGQSARQDRAGGQSGGDSGEFRSCPPNAGPMSR